MSGLKQFELVFGSGPKQLYAEGEMSVYISKKFYAICNNIVNIFGDKINIELTKERNEKRFIYVYNFDVKTSDDMSNKKNEIENIIYLFLHEIFENAKRDVDKINTGDMIKNFCEKLKDVGLSWDQEDPFRKISIDIEEYNNKISSTSIQMQMYRLWTPPIVRPESVETCEGGGEDARNKDAKQERRTPIPSLSLFDRVDGVEDCQEEEPSGEDGFDEPLTEELVITFDVSLDAKSGFVYVIPIYNGKRVKVSYHAKSPLAMQSIIEQKIEGEVLRVMASIRGDCGMNIYEVLGLDNK